MLEISITSGQTRRLTPPCLPAAWGTHGWDCDGDGLSNLLQSVTHASDSPRRQQLATRTAL